MTQMKEPWERELDKHDGDLRQDPLEQAKNSVIAALVGSCECNTKSPDAAHHMGYCRYLKLLTALDCIDAAAVVKSRLVSLLF